MSIKQVENIKTRKKEDMTDEWILNWLKTTKNPNLKGKYAEFAEWAQTKTRTQAGDGEWYYMFSDGVVGSNKSKTCDGTEQGQVEYLIERLGSGEMASDQHMLKVVVQHCAKTGEMRFDDIWGRTEGKDTAGGCVSFRSLTADGFFGFVSTAPGLAVGGLLASCGGRSPRISQ